MSLYTRIFTVGSLGASPCESRGMPGQFEPPQHAPDRSCGSSASRNAWETSAFPLRPKPSIARQAAPANHLPCSAKRASRIRFSSLLVLRGCFEETGSHCRAKMGNLAVIHDEHRHRLETKLKRELGDQVFGLLNDDRTEDILLNPDRLSVGEAHGRRIHPARRNFRRHRRPAPSAPLQPGVAPF